MHSWQGGIAMNLQGEGHKCSQVDEGKYKKIICLLI